MSVFDRPAERTDALMTDLYQLTMAAAYFENRLEHRATFEGFTRRLEADRGYLLAAGLELVLDHLEGLHFTGAQLDYLRKLPQFSKVSPAFFEWLRAFRFQGEVWAPAEGTPVFPEEPLIRVSGGAIEAQLVETYVLSVLNQQTLIATKASRIVHAARGKHVSDFGTRRAHGPEAGQLVARAAYVGGALSTSNVEAGFRLGIPVKGTFAHSWVMTFDREEEAFAAYARTFPHDTTILLDTYDTLDGARKVVKLGVPVTGVRLDSGDLAALSKEVRKILDEGGLAKTKIVASCDLNEYKIAKLEAEGGKVDIYGVGTELAVSKDQPALGGVYKLVERTDANGRPLYRAKFAKDKKSWPAAKQVYRAGTTTYEGDVIALATEPALAGKPLLERVMAGGKRTRPAPSLRAIQDHARAELAKLPEEVRRIEKPASYRVVRSEALERLAEDVAIRVK